jgi:hypothetical protein
MLAAAVALALADSATAFEFGRRRAQATSDWHGAYYDVAWGSPVALVVPPKAEYQTQWGWGVGNTRVVPISHQFQPSWPGPVHGFGQGSPFAPTPPWPNDTNQLGDYYIRGPW